MGEPSARRCGRGAAAHGDHPHRRQRPRAAANRQPAARGHPRRRPDPRPRRTDVCPHARRTRRRRHKDHRRASAEPWPSRMGHRARQAFGATRSARAGRCRYPARAGAPGRCFLARLSSGQFGQPRPVAGGTGCDPAWARLRFALRLRSYRSLGVAARLRHGGADRQWHHDTSGGVRPGQDCGATVLPGLGDRLLHRLLDGVWRDGGVGAPCAGRRQLAGADLARPGRQMDCRSGRSAGRGAEGCTRRVHRRRTGTLVDGQ